MLAKHLKTHLLNDVQPQSPKSFITSIRDSRISEYQCTIASCVFDTVLYSSSESKNLNVVLPESIRRAVAKRQAEFLAGRFTAKRALFHSGLTSQDADIPIGKNRCPVWPANAIGSISHSSSRAICAVLPKRKGAYQLIGIDVECLLSEEVCSEVGDSILTESEKQVFIDSEFPTTTSTTLAFSAKESLFKALYPHVNLYFGFEKASVVAIDKIKNEIYLDLCETLLASLRLKESTIKCHYSIGQRELMTMVVS